MPTLDLTHSQVGHLYDAAERGIEGLDAQLNDYREEPHYSADEWADMHRMRACWAAVIDILAFAIEETANAND